MWRSSILTELKGVSKMGKKVRDLKPVHPGEILREEFLAPLGMSAHALAMALRVAATRISEIVHERRGITAETALRLARYFGTTPQFWMNMQASYDLQVAETEIWPEIEAQVQPRPAA